MQAKKARHVSMLQAHKNKARVNIDYIHTDNKVRTQIYLHSTYRIEYAYLLLTYLKCSLYIAYIGTKGTKQKKGMNIAFR